MSDTKRDIPYRWNVIQWCKGFDPTRDHDSYGRGLPSYLRGELAVGPGGSGCPCCFDAPGEKRRRRIRAAKRAERRKSMHDALADLDD